MTVIFDIIIITGLVLLLFLDWQNRKYIEELEEEVDLVGGALVELLKDLHSKDVIKSKVLDHARED